MANAMVHRGPDDHGLYTDPDSRLSLAARRLSIIDLAGGHQPVGSEDGSVWAVLNGEIYNHTRLRNRLREAGHRFASHTDTEVLVHLYEEYGESLVHAIEGMYAFAIWDRRERRLLVARDRFGEKPLFYYEHADRLTFASELSALRAGLGNAVEIDAEALDAYFVLGYFPGERSAYSNVRQLPPAALLSWSEAAPRAKLSHYWSLAPATPSGRGKKQIPELADEAGELLRDSVKSRLVADVPVGVFLSGGLDSSLVASLAAEQVSGQLKTFTVGYDTGQVDELEPARQVAAHLDSDHHEVLLSIADLAQRAARVIGSLDQPNADPALLAVHAVAEAAKPVVTVAVGGEGADELFGGYPRYRWIARAQRIEHYLPPPLAEAAARLCHRSWNHRLRRLGDMLEPASLAARNLDWATAGRRQFRHQLYGPRLRQAARGDHALSDAADLLSKMTHRELKARLMGLDRLRYLPDDVLAKADRATMLASLEMRTPYLNRQLAEFSATIPAHVHTANGGKAILREIASRRPGVVSAHRAKQAFRVPMSDWLHGPLRGELEHQVHDGRLTREGWIDPQALQAVVAEHLTRAVDHSAMLWPVLATGLWLDQQAEA